MSIEDAMILSALLEKAKTPREAEVALKVYDQVRRPRTQSIVQSSRGTGLIMTGRDGNGLSAQMLKEKLSSRWDFIHQFDLKKHRDDALEKFEVELASHSSKGV